MEQRLAATPPAERFAARQALLAVDPIAALVALRNASAPIYAAPSDWSLSSLSTHLGPNLLERLLDTPATAAAREPERLALWRRTLAMAHAARDFAAVQGLNADTAYLAGLLSESAAWLELSDQVNQLVEARILLRSFGLPPHLELAATSRCGGTDLETPLDLRPWRTLLTAAAERATLAEFPHPLFPRELDALLPHASLQDLLAARQLRASVQAHLDQLGLTQGPETAFPRRRADDAPMQLLAEPASTEALLLSVLEPREGTRAKDVFVRLLAAGQRAGDFDRAFLARRDHQGKLRLRMLHEDSTRQLAQATFRLTRAETLALDDAQRRNRPMVLTADPASPPGLLAALGLSELLAAPLLTSTHRGTNALSFLLFDRGLRQAPVGLPREQTIAQTISRSGALLLENLLLRAKAERANYSALTDALTGLYNRRMAMRTIDNELARATRTNAPLSVLLCDLDHFKHLNDQFGHAAGDQALQAMAQLLQSTVRRSDTVARYGGEEFLLILPNTPAEEATVLATRVFTEVEQRGRELGLPITVSIGLTVATPQDTAGSLIHRADYALYASKGQGRNRFSIDIVDPDQAS